MSKWLFVSYFYTKGTEQGWGCITVNTKSIDSPEDITSLSNIIKKEKGFDVVVPMYFNRLELPE